MAKEKKKKDFNERNIVNKIFKEYLAYYTISTFKEFDEDNRNLIFDAIDKVVNANAVDLSEEVLIEENDYVELRLHINTIKELMFVSQSFELEDVVDSKIGEKVIGQQIKRLRDTNISLLKYSAIIAMFRNIVLTRANLFLDALYSDYNIEDEKAQKDIERLTKLIAICNEVIGLYILVEELKPKNYLIDKFSVKNGQLKVKYKTTKFAPDNILDKYKRHKSIKMLKVDLFHYWVENDSVDLKLMNCVCEAYAAYKFWGNNIPETVYIDTSVVLPFIEKKSNKDGIVDGYNTIFDGSLEKILNGKKYAMPKNGCIIKFKKENSTFKKTKVNLDNNGIYTFEIYLRENTLRNDENQFAKKMFISLNKKDIPFMIECNTNSMDEIINTPNMASRYVKSSDIRFNEPEHFKIVNSMLNSWMLCCLYCIFVDIGNSNIEISNVDNESNNYIYKGVYDRYKTAHIRKLPDGYKASEEAKKRAKEMDLILDEGYTFVREYVPAKGEAVRKITVKN